MILAQAAPGTGSNVLIYTVSKTAVTVTLITICNRDSTQETVSLWFVPKRETLATKHLVLSSLTVQPTDTFVFPHSVGLDIGDRVYVNVSGDFSITISGDI